MSNLAIRRATRADLRAIVELLADDQLGRRRGCVVVQLSSHASRVDAQRFYRRLGFEDTHVGMKLSLQEPPS